MDAAALGPERAALQRARLHVRGGRRRLRQGKISAGVATLSDALSFAMEWFCASAERRSRVQATAREFRDDRALYVAFVRFAVLSGTFDYERFDQVLERALASEIPAADAAGILEGVESVLTELGVLPFDENALPPEDPGTY
jgi:hypothetical protein